jgi:hypothetical protein
MTIAAVMGWRPAMLCRLCLTARRRNDPKQAGLSNQCPADRTVRENARPGPLPSGMGIDDESDQVT